MKKNHSVFRSGFWGVFFGLCSMVSSSSQEQAVPLPDGPLLRSWEPNEAWTISFEYQDSSGTGAASAEEIPTGTGQGRRNTFNQNTLPKTVSMSLYGPFLTMKYSGRGSAEEFRFFVTDDTYFVQAPPAHTTTRGVHPNLREPTERSFAENILLSALAKTFFGFDFVSPNTYEGIEEVEGEPCLVFRKDGTTAWVSLDKRHPVMWQRGKEVRRFLQNKTPTIHNFPEDVIKRLRGIMKDRERLRRRNTSISFSHGEQWA
jgi:hypothetical protein